MSHKSQGINAERELIHAFWKLGWASIRIAGSGASRYPTPDVLAGKGSRKIAIECKSSKDTAKYLTAKEVSELREFSRIFGAEPWIGMRFHHMEWYFLSLEDLRESRGSFCITVELAKEKGLRFDELIGNI